MKANSKSSEQVIKTNARVRRGLLWGVLIVVMVGIVVANIWSLLHRRLGAPTNLTAGLSSELAVHKQVPDFSLTDQSGAPFARSNLRGKIWVADFIFTSCVTSCPLMTDTMAKLQGEFAKEDVYFVSFSVDSERDTPEVLARYANRYGADLNKWSFLTGEKGAIYQLAHEGFSLAAGSQGSEILHSARFALVDRHGQIRGYYDSQNQAVLQKLRRDIKVLLRQQPPF